MEVTVDDPHYQSNNETDGSLEVHNTAINPIPPVQSIPSSTESGIIPKIHNVVCCVDLGCYLDLCKIAFRLRNAEYNPRRFHAVIMRILDPKTAALIFRTGKIVVTGAKSETAAHLAARKYARLIQKLGFDVRFKDYKIQNLVATCDVKFPIKIEDMFTCYYQFSRYEPELFPGLIYRMVQPRVVLLVFVSGKIVITGAKSTSELKEAFENLYPVLKMYRKL
ncbi:uncharacterized protein [Parasteatoda tepidariorum]|uniref:uncharacterized protein n=1 Tax=Parasteatoda tepidariorum TaxID=114398 RepID=UPI00077FC343|nr:TATA-box-binding protein [Parasteatoda tepidariorum]